MARIMLVLMPFAGHVAPMRSIAAELVTRGHEVRAYTGAAYREAFETVGARHLPWVAASDFDENDLAATFPELGNRHGPVQLIANLEQVFVGTGAGQLRDLQAAWDDEPWDVLLSETTSVGGALAAERFSAPWVTVSIVPLTYSAPDRPIPGLGLKPGHGPLIRGRDALLRGLVSLVSRRVDRALENARAEVGLDRRTRSMQDATTSTQLTLATGVPALDYAPFTRPDWVRFVGRIPPVVDRESAMPAWWPELENAEVPIVLVTQGTLNIDPAELIRPTLRALDGADVLVVATTGKAGVAFDFPVPANARISHFLPFDRLLPLTSIMITNGGWGGTLAGLAAGVPLIIAGGDLDKPEIASRVAFAGAGIDLRTGRPKSAAISRAFGRITTDPSYRAAAERIAGELAGHDGPAEVAEAVAAFVAARG